MEERGPLPAGDAFHGEAFAVAVFIAGMPGTMTQQEFHTAALAGLRSRRLEKQVEPVDPDGGSAGEEGEHAAAHPQGEFPVRAFAGDVAPQGRPLIRKLVPYVEEPDASAWQVPLGGFVGRVAEQFAALAGGEAKVQYDVAEGIEVKLVVLLREFYPPSACGPP